ncbi:MAG: methionine--tRNA ligase [Dongiaceae bacterium]
MKKNYYITTPIYYVNDAPHIGHAYSSLACDVLARFKRLDGYQVHFQTGTDEHGQKVEKSAKAAGISPQEFTDKVSQQFRDLGRAMNFSEDNFIRTTEPRHIKAAQALWDEMVKRGDIYLGSYAGWYAVRDEAFYDESELVNGKAPTGADVEWVEEPSYFFKLASWQDRLLEFYEKNPGFIAPESRRNEVISFVKSGLKDLSVSRTTFKWGVPIPGAPEHIMYVWVDALTNYLTAVGYPDTNSASFKQFWPADLHMMGKDIIRFHAVYWPAFLMAAGLKPPKRVFAHGWWTNEGQKISKSLGNVIDPHDLIARYGLDPIRYFLLREVPFGQDGDFSHAAAIRRINTALANDFGNLVQRSLSMVQRYHEGSAPDAGQLNSADMALLKSAHDLVNVMRKHFDVQAFHLAIEAHAQVVSAANRYIDEQAPWNLRKTDQTRLNVVLWVLIEVIRNLGITIQPVMPQSGAKILDQLVIPADQRDFKACDIAHAVRAGTALPAPTGVFPRLEEIAA